MGYNEDIVLQDAEREKVALKLCLNGVTGSGKTMGALLIGYGMMKEKYPDLEDNKLWSKIAIIDTENRSGSLYVNYNRNDVKIGKYKTIPITPPYSPARYIQAIDLCEENGIEVAIIDSFSAAWSSTGGILDKQAEAAKKVGVNSYTAWREITPLHNKLIDKILQSPVHIIATLRNKMEHVMEKEGDKTVIKKVGLASIQRDGVEYEFTMVFDIDNNHNSFGSKDRSGIFDQRSFVITSEEGKNIMKWLNEATVEAPVYKNSINPADMLLFIKTTYSNLPDGDIKAKIKQAIKDNGIVSLTDASANDLDNLTLTYKEVKQMV